MNRCVCFIFYCLLALLNLSCLKEKVEGSCAIEVTDYAGRTVKLQKPAKKIVVMADNALVVVKQLDSIQTVIALDSKTLTNFKFSILSTTDPSLADLPDVGSTKSPNYEFLVSITPDLVLLKGDKDAGDVLAEKTGIPTACVKSINGYDFNLYLFIGKLLGQDERAEFVVKQLEKHKEYLENKLSVLKNDEKKSAYLIIQNSGKNLYKTQKFCQAFELACLENVAKDATRFNEWGTVEFSKEEVLNITPDLVFLDYNSLSTSISKDTVYNDSIFSLLYAIKNKRLYYTHNFSLPKDYVYVVAEAYYYAHLAYPQIIDEVQYRSAINAIFEATYGIENYYEDWEKPLL